MTRPRPTDSTEAQLAEQPKLDAEVVEDLDPPADDADELRGGNGACGGGKFVPFTIHIAS